MAKKVSVLALIGGRGTRMDILCKTRPKPVLPVSGYRLIDFTLSNCIQSKISSLGVIADYLRAEAKSYLARWRRFNGKYLDLTVLEPDSGAYKGTADAVFQNLPYLAGQKSDIAILLAGDHIYQMDYSEMLDRHLKKGADITVGVTRVPLREVHRYGMVEIDKVGRITGFTEKPAQPTDNLVSMGIYIFNTDVLKKNLIKDAADSGSCHDFGYSILPPMAGKRRMFAYEFRGYWKDVGTIESYYQGNLDLLDMFSQEKGEQWAIYTDKPGYCMRPVNRGNIINSLVGRGCVIDGRVENSILGDRVVVDSAANVKNSIIMDDSYVGVGSEVLTSIIDERVSIGSQSVVGYVPKWKSGTREISVVAKGVNLPPQCIVGKHCTVLPSGPNASNGLYSIEPRAAVLP